jgi:hypothetical protein
LMTFMNKRISGGVNISSSRSIFFWVKRLHVLTAFSARFQSEQRFNFLAVGGWFDRIFNRGPFCEWVWRGIGQSFWEYFSPLPHKTITTEKHCTIVMFAIANE